MEYPGINGFLGTRASLLLDIAYVILLGIIPVFVWSLDVLFLQKNYLLHKRVQLLLTAAYLLACALLAAGYTMHDWRERAITEPGEVIPRITYMTLVIHVVFVVVTLVIWVGLLIQALRKIPSPPGPCDFAPTYVFWLLLLSLQSFLAVLTGWEFYMLAFCF